jgi:hypothetical protein
VSGLNASHYNGMVSDGTRVHVAGGVSALWDVGTNGGDVVTLNGGELGIASVPIPLLPAHGGLFFNDDVSGLVWESAEGGAPQPVSTSSAAFFDWSGARAYAMSKDGYGPGTIDVLSLEDGSRQPFVTFDSGDDVATALVTSRFLHLVLVIVSTSIEYVDRRIDLAGGSQHDEVALHSANSQIFMGPNAICVLSADDTGISCLRDGEAAPDYIPVGSASLPRYIDADWVYAAVFDNQLTFARFSLTDGHEQLLGTGVYPEAVATFGRCVYAVILPTGDPTPNSAALWRYSPG